MRHMYIALVHHPVLGRDGATVTSAITNLDVHDLSRSARTYGAKGYFLVHPIPAQRQLIERILAHWEDGASGTRIPDRKEALRVVRLAPSLEAMYEELGGRSAIEVWGTSARTLSTPMISFAEGRSALTGDGPPIVLLFGTSWGLRPDTLAECDRVLEPIHGGRDSAFNHLSVRSACAIALDRLLSA
jgi:hypothetical protein